MNILFHYLLVIIIAIEDLLSNSISLGDNCFFSLAALTLLFLNLIFAVLLQ